MQIFEKSTCFFSFSVLLYTGTCEVLVYAPVAQLDRVTGYEPVGQGFESLPAYQKSRYSVRNSGFSYMLGGLERPLRKHAGGMFLGRGRVLPLLDASRRDVDCSGTN